ncbi:MAG: M15 family metallopeptidase [Gaiellaceae bacterium]
MNRLFGLALVSISLAGTLVSGASSSPVTTPFRSKISPLAPELRAQMTGVSWHRGCPVPLSGLRLLTLSYRGFDGRSHTGRLVVKRFVAAQVVTAFRKLYNGGFPIRRMQLVDAYGGSDFRSIEADNTSAFNCRNATGSSHWSNHAYGLAIDVNPIENPYVTASGSVAHKASRPYLNRSRIRPGMAYQGGVLVNAFHSIGWGWGGYWSGDRDYQHFSVNGG